MLTIDQLKQVHPVYAKHSRLAQYLSKSYIGGEEYRAGEYLTQYVNELATGTGHYDRRLQSNPLNNYVKTTIDIYRSFLFRELPARTLGTLTDNPLVQQWLLDTDQDGQSMDSFMKSVNDLACVQGNVWILVDKPAYAVQTQAQEIALGIRAYACVYTPQNVLNWRYERSITGKNVLQEIRVVESESQNHITISVWTPEQIQRYTIAKDSTGEYTSITDYSEFTNPLAEVPFICYAPIPGAVRGTGYSLVEDVADQQRFIYNLNSELFQTIRISSHPSLVKTAATQANAGAGAVITMPEDLEPGLAPFLLQPTGATVSGILDTINQCVETIQRTTHTSAVQATRTSATSGVALQTERQLLNAKLSDIADTLEETEIKMWRLWSMWQNISLPADFSIDYIDTFDIRDSHSELALYEKAMSLVPNAEFQQYVQSDVVGMIVEDPQEAARIRTSLTAPQTHPDLSGLSMAERQAHIQEMLMSGISNAEILRLHPELTVSDIVAAGAAAAASN